MHDMVALDVEQILSSYSNLEKNADAEKLMMAVKKELIRAKESSSFQQAKESLGG